MKKILILLCLLPTIILAGCGAKPAVDMDQPSADGRYHYRNPDLGFAVSFPAEFIYYQTQRSNLGNYVDMEYFVPTSDLDYLQLVPGYGRAVVIRVIDEADLTAELKDETDIIGFVKIAEGNGRSYYIDFWAGPPADWAGKWSEAMKNGISESFEIL